MEGKINQSNRNLNGSSAIKANVSSFILNSKFEKSTMSQYIVPFTVTLLSQFKAATAIRDMSEDALYAS